MFDSIKNKISEKSAADKRKDTMALEMRRCKSGPAYFARNYVYIKHKKKGQIKFDLWDFQETCLGHFQSHRMNIILKARQLGMTELLATYILWFCLFQRDKTVVVVSKNRKAASDLVKRVKYSYKKLPAWLKITKMVSDNVHTVEFDNDSVIFADATTDNAGRGIACSLFVVDEAAFIDQLEEMWSSIFPTIDNGGACVMLSTPNGASGAFYDLYQHAPANGFNPIKLDWDCHPERDQEWYERTRASMSARKFAQEFLCDWLLTGDTVIDGNDIARHEKAVSSDRREYGPGKDIWVWKDYGHLHRYCMGCDVARGDGEDFSAFVVYDVDTKEIVCEYKGKIKVDKFAETIFAVGNIYGTCLVVVENNSYGLAVLMKLIDMKYKNLYYEEKGSIYREGYVDFELDDVVPGFTTTLKTRILMIDWMEESIRINNITTFSERMIYEMRNFVYINGKPQARKGSNDDLIMALSICLYVSSIVFGSKEYDYELRKKVLDRFSFIEYNGSTKSPGERGFDKDRTLLTQDPIDPYKFKMKEQSIDFRWVLGPGAANKKEDPKNDGIKFLGFIRD